MTEREYYEQQFSERIEVTHLANSPRSGWFRADCVSDDWYAEGWEPNVEDAAWDHLAADHKPEGRES